MTNGRKVQAWNILAMASPAIAGETEPLAATVKAAAMVMVEEPMRSILKVYQRLERRNNTCDERFVLRSPWNLR